MKSKEEIEKSTELYTNKIVEVAYHNFPLVHPKETVSKVITALLKEYTTQCQEDNKDKKYTEEDMRAAMICVIVSNSIKNSQDITEYIASINKQD